MGENAAHVQGLHRERGELIGDNLGRVFGGLPNDGNAPTINWDYGTYDAQGTAHLTRGGRPDAQP